MNPVTELCRNLRNNATAAEKTLWAELRRRNIQGKKFLRQFPIFIVNGFGRKSFYIADFYCAEYKLVIEVDGPIHLLKKDYDANRDIVMKEWSFKIFRFTNDEVMYEIDNVMTQIDFYLFSFNKAFWTWKLVTIALWTIRAKALYRASYLSRWRIYRYSGLRACVVLNATRCGGTYMAGYFTNRLEVLILKKQTSLKSGYVGLKTSPQVLLKFG